MRWKNLQRPKCCKEMSHTKRMQEVRWYYQRLLALSANAPFGKGACRPLCNPLLLWRTKPIETTRRSIPANVPRWIGASSDEPA